jgi:D-alanyl-D-alanine carboxypeptidase/D-alanyl-D-alanine-endopeptidase (penicillin-binding protein 4)
VKPPRTAALVALVSAVLTPACAGSSASTASPRAPLTAAVAARDRTDALEQLFEDPALARATVAIHVASLTDGRVVYSRNAAARMVPGSLMKIVTAAVAADRLGWDYRFETRLETTGRVDADVLTGDLVIVGSGDPTINARDLQTAPLFEEWADLLGRQGIRRVEGRIVGDDSALEDEPLGAGWAWDYLTAAYAPPSGALNYNEGLAAVRVAPAATVGEAAVLDVAPAGHDLVLANQVRTGPANSPAAIVLSRLPGRSELVVRGSVPLGGPDQLRATPVANPTLFFASALRHALAGRGIDVTGQAVDIDDIELSASPRTVLARHRSLPLSAVIAQMMKSSPNLYGEVLLKVIGRDGRGAVGSADAGRAAVLETLTSWGLSGESLVMYDGSGLSRYNYLSADLLVAVLAHVWANERLRGPYVAALPVAGHDGTLSNRMQQDLRRRVQAKTGSLNHVRTLAGYVETEAGEKLVFAMLANHFVAPASAVDEVMERALELLAADR